MDYRSNGTIEHPPGRTPYRPGIEFPQSAFHTQNRPELLQESWSDMPSMIFHQRPQLEAKHMDPLVYAWLIDDSLA